MRFALGFAGEGASYESGLVENGDFSLLSLTVHVSCKL